MTDRSQITWIEPVMNKINAFLSDERMRQMLSASKSSFNFREIMDNKKHLLIKLDKGKLKDTSDLLGSLFMAKIQMAAFSRSDIPKHERTPFYLYIDEFQNFASDSFKVILSEARKYGLSLIMAHQTLSQIPDDLRGLILGSAGIQVYFRINRHDAQLLAKEAFEYSGFEVKMPGSKRPVFWSLAEEWELKTEELQKLPPRMCYVKHKIEGGLIPIETVTIQPAWEMFEASEQEYLEVMKLFPLGWGYLISRKDLTEQADKRRQAIEEEIKKKLVKEIKPLKVIPKTATVEPEQLPAKAVVVYENVEPISVSTDSSAKVEREHRRLQHLIKRVAEQHGYRATIEQPTDDGQGRVDVGLERNGTKTACEISITSTVEYELHNLEKCLASGFEKVILCSPEKRTLDKVRKQVESKFDETNRAKILFLTPDDLVIHLEEEAAREAGSEDRVKGYKVNVRYQPVKEAEKMDKRQAIAQVLLRSFQREKKAAEK